MSAKQTIIDLENAFWQAILDKDSAAASGMLGETTIIAGAQGAASIDRATFTQMLFEGGWELHEFSLTDVVVDFPKPDIATIAYTVSEKLTVDGKPVDLKAADTSVWVEQDGQWKCVLHTESVLGDPLGRDKK